MQCRAHLSKIGQQNYMMTVRLPQYRLTVHTYAFVTMLTTVFAIIFCQTWLFGYYYRQVHSCYCLPHVYSSCIWV